MSTVTDHSRFLMSLSQRARIQISNDTSRDPTKTCDLQGAVAKFDQPRLVCINRNTIAAICLPAHGCSVRDNRF